MNRTLLAIGTHVAIIALVFLGPLMVALDSGPVVYLETEKMDPRSLFRGHYVILGYGLAQNQLPQDIASIAAEKGLPVYVVITNQRPAAFVRYSLDKPVLQAGEACLVGRARGWGGSIDFPQIAQYFAAREEAQALEGLRGEDLLAVVKTTRGCDAQLQRLEAR